MINRTFSLRNIVGVAAAGLMAAALAAPAASAQINFGIRIGTAPPPLRYEARPAIPGPGYVWVDGYWEPDGGHYRWHPGYWNRPPYEGAYYVHPHWDHYPDGWHMHEGYWAHDDHQDHDNHYWDNHPHGDDHRDDHGHDDHPHQ